MSFFEMLQFYAYSVPEIVLYILPITFFASSVITLAKMSFDLELIVVFALQAGIKEIIKPFVFLSIIVTVNILVIGFILKPITKYKIEEFVQLKKENAQINIKPSEFGQNFGNWLLFVKDKKDNKTFQNIALFSKDKSSETFINAGEASFINSKGKFRLILEKGHAYNFSENEVEQIKFNKMVVNENAHMGELKFDGIIKYWQSINDSDRLRKDIAFTILTSFFPLLSLLLIISLGIFNPRYEKNRSAFYSIVFIILYFVLLNIIGSRFPYLVLIIVPAVWLSISYYIYHLRVRKIY